MTHDEKLEHLADAIMQDIWRMDRHALLQLLRRSLGEESALDIEVRCAVVSISASLQMIAIKLDNIVVAMTRTA